MQLTQVSERLVNYEKTQWFPDQRRCRRDLMITRLSVDAIYLFKNIVHFYRRTLAHWG
jgi:hypothetical protein